MRAVHVFFRPVSVVKAGEVRAIIGVILMTVFAAATRALGKSRGAKAMHKNAGQVLAQDANEKSTAPTQVIT